MREAARQSRRHRVPSNLYERAEMNSSEISFFFPSTHPRCVLNRTSPPQRVENYVRSYLGNVLSSLRIFFLLRQKLAIEAYQYPLTLFILYACK